MVTKTKTKQTKIKNKNRSPAPASTTFTHNKALIAARMLGCLPAQIDKITAGIRKTLTGLGTVEKHTHGRSIVYADRAFSFQFNAARHVVKALTRAPIDCPISKALADSSLGAYVSSVHVGNAVVTMWSMFCPDIIVKFWLSPELMAAVRDWDEQSKKKQKNRRFRLANGTYCIVKCPPTYRHTTRSVRGTGVIRGANTKKSTRRLTVKSDIAFTSALLKHSKATAGKKAR